ncbi:MAG TPA: ABC transporter substrate-binding protein [Burkholderiales bacterium]|nr:ABC transporter substrate-binding protein [Burkholderiales bacterium]
MKRRDFIVLASGVAAVASPIRAFSQRSTMPVIGFLNSALPGPFAHLVAAFRQGLGEIGYVEGRNVSIEYRWAQNRYERLPDLATDLVRRQVAVIVAGGGNVSALAAKAATSTIPIVFPAAADPVKAQLVASLNRPGGNVTGIAALTVELDAKRLGLLRELVPKGGKIGALVNPNRPDSDSQVRDLQTAAETIGQQIVVLHAGTERDLDTAFATLAQQRVDALLVGADPFFASQRAQLIALTQTHAVPAIYQFREFAVAGGLMSYGANLADSYRLAGVYAGRILKGEKPAELPVMQPTKFELVLNLQTAKKLGLAISREFLARVDEVIE